jgi:pyridoxal phosphate enzyme (YggS family)
VTDQGARREELLANIRALGRRVGAACAAAGRPRADITVIAVTKTFPVSDIAALIELGITDIGENRDQEAAPKAAACAAMGLAPRWHFVGQLQVNKAASVASYADIVHSVDRHRLVAALGARAGKAGRVITCLVQVSLDEPAAGTGGAAPDGPHARGGAAPAAVPRLAAEIAATEGLALGGVMAVAPLGERPGAAFQRLRQVADQVRSEYPEATMISAGMSGDLEDAVLAGATHLRIGTALLGGRPAFVR